jgi:hypothetical protein
VGAFDEQHVADRGRRAAHGAGLVLTGPEEHQDRGLTATLSGGKEPAQLLGSHVGGGLDERTQPWRRTVPTVTGGPLRHTLTPR